MSKLTYEQSLNIEHILDGGNELEEMLDWLFDHGGYNIRKTWLGVSKFSAQSYDEKDIFFIGTELTWTEAAYKAICIIEGHEP